MLGTVPRPIAAVLDAYKRRLERRFGDRLRPLRLFGSWARGQARPDSDVDVAVVVADLTRTEWQEAVADAVDAEDEADTGVVLAPFVLSAERFNALAARQRRIACDIVTEGVVL